MKVPWVALNISPVSLQYRGLSSDWSALPFLLVASHSTGKVTVQSQKRV